MTTIFLSYARADGQPAALRLRSELERAGFSIWRDIEDMQGGQSWKGQRRQAIRTVDIVIVLLTPASVVSKYVEWEWETAITLGKKVIPLLVLPCEVPSELQHLHYHNMSTEQDYTLSFAALTRDLHSASSTETDPNKRHSSSQSDSPGKRGIAISGDVADSNLVTGDGNSINTSSSVANQEGKYNIKIDKADNTRIGDEYNS